MQNIIKKYLKALEIGSYDNMIKLFAEDAIIFSPLYGKIKAVDFYKHLFKDTSESKITLINIFKSDNKFIGAGHFRYDWKLADGTPTSFECVDVFQFTEGGKIKQLTIIYDTAKIRPSFEKMKE
ncbi:nuclear transport factor 2 family protein [Candidatus Woesearchaeota archaeon]|nr:nuclear transport factor 2 family protein [Candidatus Woesearchaeota archaeon]